MAQRIADPIGFDRACHNGDKSMIQKVVKIKSLEENDSRTDDLEYWLKRPPEERVAAVDYLRRQYHGSSARLQRVARVIQRQEG